MRKSIVIVFFLVFSGCRTIDTPQPDSCNTSPDTFALYRQKVVDQVNEYRATVGLAALVRAVDKDSCADAQACNDASVNQAHNAFGNCGESAQNECPEYSRAEAVCTQCLAMMWAEGPGEPYSAHGHYINMTNPSYRKISVGFSSSQNGTVWCVMNFY